MIMYARALYRSFKVKWIGKVYFPTHYDTFLQYIERTQRQILGGVQPHFCPWKNVCFPTFSHREKWGKKYMEREGNEYFSLSFHILFFPFFPLGKNGKTHIFPWAKMGLNPPPQILPSIAGPLRDTKPHLKKKTTVVNISNEHITNDELELLSLGLKFTPTPMNDPPHCF